jgi:hypothetical protein
VIVYQDYNWVGPIDQARTNFNADITPEAYGGVSGSGGQAGSGDKNTQGTYGSANPPYVLSYDVIGYGYGRVTFNQGNTGTTTATLSQALSADTKASGPNCSATASATVSFGDARTAF